MLLQLYGGCSSVGQSAGLCKFHKRVLDPSLFSKYTVVMALVTCLQCTKEFYIKPNRQAKGWGKYCSNNCKHLGFKTGNLILCTFCNKTTYKNRKDQSRSVSGNFFCNKSCHASWRNLQVFGNIHANWKSGESSYRDILRRTDRLQVCAKCMTDDKRILAVHHIDKNRQNNAVSNLLWLCHNCHFLVHHDSVEATGFIVNAT